MSGHVVITGASSGIGYSLARRLAKRGWRVSAIARRYEKLSELQQHEGSIFPLAADVSVPEQIKSALLKAENASGSIDMAILNAGIYTPVDVKRFSGETFVKQMQVNYFGIIHCLDHLLPAMLARGSGHLALMGSVAGYRGLPKSAAYGPTKAAIQNLAECMYFDLNPKGIKLQVINPGFVETEATSVNDFVMPDLISSDVAAEHVIQGLQEDIFEISFPKSFVRKLKLMRLLPSHVYLNLTAKLTGYK